eukprot:TRINITY_DN1060_c0_g1_i1.p1 TRINITY_DN1060_c0_g1~~TRINITY_DN1060_c0_g1_i1.p1  ORF type:complete len:324 (+),score=70.59 TRINITY_DN1060_c0_g1_i1:1673-2644(+)
MPHNTRPPPPPKAFDFDACAAGAGEEFTTLPPLPNGEGLTYGHYLYGRTFIPEPDVECGERSAAENEHNDRLFEDFDTSLAGTVYEGHAMRPMMFWESQPGITWVVGPDETFYLLENGRYQPWCGTSVRLGGKGKVVRIAETVEIEREYALVEVEVAGVFVMETDCCEFKALPECFREHAGFVAYLQRQETEDRQGRWSGHLWCEEAEAGDEDEEEEEEEEGGHVEEEEESELEEVEEDEEDDNTASRPKPRRHRRRLATPIAARITGRHTLRLHLNLEGVGGLRGKIRQFMRLCTEEYTRESTKEAVAKFQRSAFPVPWDLT